jgi:hypothetical protein
MGLKFEKLAANVQDAAARAAPHRQTALLIWTIGLFLGLYLMGAFLHAVVDDESYYGRAAVSFANGDVLLHRVDVDKPPLAMQAFGVALAIFGRSEMALKLPNAMALAVLLAVVFFLGKDLFGGAVGLLAAALLATSPFLARVGIGAMLDPFACSLLLCSLFLAVRGRRFGAGFFMGLALCTRQMAAAFLPITFLAAWLIARPPEKFWRAVKQFAGGLCGPLAYLFAWSAFYEREPFAWLVTEIRSGHIVEAAAHTSFWTRLSFWFGLTARDFFLTPRFWQTAAACAVALGAIRLARRRPLAPLGGPAKIALCLFASAVPYYPLSHALIGISLTADRMMLPLLPLVALLASFAIVRILTAVGLTGERSKWAGALLLAALVLVGVNRNVRAFYVARTNDDTPEIARFIRGLPPGKKVLLSDGLARPFFFPLFGVDILVPTKAAKIDQLETFVRRYQDRRVLLALSRHEMDELPRWQAALAPRYRFDWLTRSSRGLLALYEISPAARFVETPSGAAVETYVDGSPVATPVSVAAVDERLQAFLAVALEAAGAPYASLAPDPQRALADGYFSRLTLRAPGAKLRRLRTRAIDIEYRNGRLDLLKLFGAGQLVVTDCDNAAGAIEVDAEGLAAFIKGNNPDLRNVTVAFADSGVDLAGQFRFLGKWAAFAMNAGLCLDPNGNVLLAARGVEAAGRTLPSVFLGLVDRSVNPTLSSRIEALDLQGETLRTADGLLILELRKKN